MLFSKSLSSAALSLAFVVGGTTIAAADALPPASATPASPAPAAPAPDGASAAASTICDPLSSVVNRPTTTRITCVVPKNHVLIESGFSSLKSEGVRSQTYPAVTLRAGTSVKHLEVEVFTPSYTRQRGNGVDSGGVTDAGVGAAYQLGASSRFAHVVQASLTIPTGDPQFTSGGYAPTLSYQGVYSISKIFSVSAGLAQTSRVQVSNGQTERNGVFTPSVILSASLPNATTLFAEDAHSSHDRGKGTGLTQYIVGVLKDFGPRTQVDLEYIHQRARNNGTPDTTASGFGAGLAYYF